MASKTRIVKGSDSACSSCGKDADLVLASAKPWQRFWFCHDNGDAYCHECHKEVLAESKEPEQTPEEKAWQAVREVQSCDVYAKVRKTHTLKAGQITTLLMEMSAKERTRLMTDSAFFASKVEEAAKYC